jgi:hypothetical protein
LLRKYIVEVKGSKLAKDKVKWWAYMFEMELGLVHRIRQSVDQSVFG